MSPKPSAVIVLSAGDGTRMKSSLNKALHRIGGRTLVGHAVAAAAGTGATHVAVVVRAQKEQVAEAARVVLPEVVVAEQDDVYGTGRAAECGLLALPDNLTGTVLVTTGDTPLLSSTTLLDLTAHHESTGSAVTVITGILPDATGYGRIVRGPSGDVEAIVEHKQATEEQRRITEFNSGLFAFDAGLLRDALAGLGVNAAAGEKYLTDVVEIAVAQGKRVQGYVLDDLWQTEGVNDKAQLARLGHELNRRTLDTLMREQGAIVIDPATTWVDVDVTVGRDTVIEPGCQLRGATTIGADCVIGPDSTIKDCEIRDGASVIRTHAELAVIGEKATVGPFAYLRPGSELGQGAKIGTYVETKNAQLGAGAKVPHLSYIGDATIGEGTNIGAASVTVNYDGVNKHRTTIGAHCRMGSDNMYVAPVTVGDGAGSGAGAIIRKDVPPGALAISVAPQRNIEGWVVDKRPGTRQAEAAEAAARHTDEASAEGRNDA
ncbi:bifunctional UDP-N-acetylglucosamine diphosphorylase/glucosamine-1-phosphate N-acetyltransferase GlmU [Metallococcus carri]|uniref:bifunctional UDP-N-acetylglucosamine diphosphorylase/glucosamine-1-phosphate N-acetyltransferase GlmU n=1 Tax=Metallococcus carri TaxID=1656884 RepID=UPI002E282EDA|nr:bifunctional UDP-N-acetylglucosamine diphosphorylase/glucosamine-1-phosphate N-acetyltransferase GlmU [Metallococcus carri]